MAVGIVYIRYRGIRGTSEIHRYHRYRNAKAINMTKVLLIHSTNYQLRLCFFIFQTAKTRLHIPRIDGNQFEKNICSLYFNESKH